MWVLGLSGGADSCDAACLRRNLVCDESDYNTGSSPGYAAGSAGTPASVGSDPDSYDGLNNILHVAQANGGGQLVLPAGTDYIGSTGKSFDYCPAFEERTNGDRMELQNNHALFDCAAVSGQYKTSRQRMCWCSAGTIPGAGATWLDVPAANPTYASGQTSGTNCGALLQQWSAPDRDANGKWNFKWEFQMKFTVHTDGMYNNLMLFGRSGCNNNRQFPALMTYMNDAPNSDDDNKIEVIYDTSESGSQQGFGSNTLKVPLNTDTWIRLILYNGVFTLEFDYGDGNGYQTGATHTLSPENYPQSGILDSDGNSIETPAAAGAGNTPNTYIEVCGKGGNSVCVPGFHIRYFTAVEATSGPAGYPSSGSAGR
tara:strand:+ start:1462 stop:2571 length:1110 start_codon:yes stop_codon:yes gene_type:complete